MTSTLDQSSPGSGNDEPSVLDYARFHGLTINYASQRPVQCVCSYALRVENASWSTEPTLSPPFEPAIISHFKERLVVSVHAIELLSEICKVTEESAFEDCTVRPVRVARFKQEQPLLKSDTEYELLHFGKRVEPDLRNLSLESAPADEEQDEGLCWPSQLLQLPATVMSRIGTEKLGVGNELALFLYETIGPTAIEPKLSDTDLGVRGDETCRIQPITPPLLPLSPPMSLLKSVAPTEGLKLLSDQSEPLATESRDIERRLMADDAPTPEHTTLMLDDGSSSKAVVSSISPLRYIAETPILSPSPKRKLKDSKVEVPLTPLLRGEYPNKRSKRFSSPNAIYEHEQTLLYTIPRDKEPSLCDASSDRLIPEDLLPFAEQAEVLLRDERLIEADSTKRVRVPSISQQLPLCPWKQHSRGTQGQLSEQGSELKAQSRLLQKIKEHDMGRLQQWHGNTKVERQLSWTPFPLELAKAHLNESIADRIALGQMLTRANSSQTLDTDTLCWKRDGLRILDDVWKLDEEELESIEADEALEEVVRHHKSRPAQPLSTDQDPANAILQSSVKKQSRQLSLQQKEATAYANVPMADNGLLFGGVYLSPADIADLFNSSDKSRQRQTPILHPVPATADPSPPYRALNVHRDAETAASHLPGPDLPHDMPSLAFVVRSSFVSSRRSLIRHIKEFYPNVEFVEREWSCVGQQKQHQSTKRPPMADDGDVIMSASTALMLTSLAKIKQRSLPGQNMSHYGARERLVSIATRFECVIVLVSDGAAMHQPFKEIDDRDAQALAELVGFGAAIDADVQVMYVPGGEVALAKWIVALMLRFAGSSVAGVASPKLLQYETTWEIFLRRLGLNSHAAQGILDALKAPTLPQASEGSSDFCNQSDRNCLPGLPAFVTMTPEERLTTLGPLLGGQKVLKGINMKLAAGWRGTGRVPVAS